MMLVRFSCVFLFAEILNAAVGQMTTNEAVHLSGSLITSSVKRIEICAEPQKSDVKLLLHHRDSKKPITIHSENIAEVNGSKKIIFLIHGWLSSPTSYGFPELKEAYLKRFDCNLILVDWSQLALQMYQYSVCQLPKVAQIVGNFLCVVNTRLQIPLKTVHLVGHSLGGQMSGLIGQRTLEKCSKRIGKVTAMDPAGPLFQGLSEPQRLDKSDAEFVQVLHTSQGYLGYKGSCGHVDFYVNCGSLQPGCPSPDFRINSFKDYSFIASSCDHFRSVSYVVKNLNGESFLGKVCENCSVHCPPNSSSGTEVAMGEECPKSAFGEFVVFTKT